MCADAELLCDVVIGEPARDCGKHQCRPERRSERENGRFVRFKTLYVHFKEIVKKMGRPEVRFHDVRHTFATLSLQSHVDPKTLSEALGHATVAFTLDVYGHSNEDMKQEAADKLEQLICQY